MKMKLGKFNENGIRKIFIKMKSEKFNENEIRKI